MALLDTVDPQGLEEFSVVFTDRSLNSMSGAFQGVMRDIHAMLCEVYGAASAVVIPGGGSFAMEAVARQFARERDVLVVRNGWFSYRWTQIFDAGGFAQSTTVVMARAAGNGAKAPFAPPPIDEVCAKIRETKHEAVFAQHVETSAGIILPDDYIAAMAAAAHEVGALLVLDCIASGCIWVDMAATGVDVVITDSAGNAVQVQTKGRHDPCVGIRATPIAEALLALVLMDHALRHRAQNADVRPGIPDISQPR